MTKTLVTGVTGFTGGKLCRRLVADGHEVIAFITPHSFQGKKSLVSEYQDMGVDCQPVDIKDRETVIRLFEGVETVYHIAAAYRTEHSHHDEFRLVNVEGTRNLLDAAKKFQVKRFVHCSTVGVQGTIEDPPADEDYRFCPGDHYQQSKMDGELLARTYFDEGLPVSVVRPVGIYGPGDSRFLKLFKPINKGRFFMIGTGQVLYHMTYIDDLIDGIILCGTRDEALGEVFTIGGERYTTIRVLVDTIADVLGKKPPKLSVPFFPVAVAAEICDKICRPLGISPPLYPRRVEFFQSDRAFSIEKARTLLGYQPKVNLREGLSRTADWYREKGLI